MREDMEDLLLRLVARVDQLERELAQRPTAEQLASLSHDVDVLHSRVRYLEATRR